MGRRLHPVSFAIAAIAAVAIAGCAGTTQRAGTGAGATDGPLASSADPAGRMTGYQFARRYDDVVKIDGRDVRQTVEYGFDYDRKATVRRITAPDGTVMSEELFPAESLRANEAESARLLELVRTHPQLGPMMSEPGLIVHRGGFVVREPDDPYCGEGSRCLRFIVSKGDGSIPFIHAIVDLVSDRVVHPFEDNSTHPAASAATESKS